MGGRMYDLLNTANATLWFLVNAITIAAIGGSDCSLGSEIQKDLGEQMCSTKDTKVLIAYSWKNKVRKYAA